MNSQPLEPQPSALPIEPQTPFFILYQRKNITRVNIKIANTKPKNLTHPSLVKISYRYLGTPPRIRIKKDRQAANFVVKANENSVE